ncbi:DUF3097 family protein [Dermatobacter hominis]|uniref:DUF3097 family protein n=1 Tax=Dermatobacter hominis TaxID=2884263 RepID=UPI001D1080F6|nr:DUF3097 family protein [Dermatobacter hominis]UDY37808.1 DUF3097 domain-containing protein [Dermatobacter hominis]
MQRDILDEAESSGRGLADAYPRVGATVGLQVLHRPTGLRGKVNKFTGEIVELRDPGGREHRFRNRPGAFAVDGETVTLVRPAAPTGAAAGLRRTAAGALVADHAPAKVAKASRIWVEGSHDARLLERVWGDDLRELGIVVEPMGGIDDLVERVREFEPGPQRRLAVLVDHLVPGSKETRIAEQVEGPHVLVVGHRYVDVWECVRPVSLGIAAWPQVPRGEDWKAGVCRRLGWGDPQDGWRRVLSAVDSFADLEPDLVGSVERALDALADAD